MLFEDTHANEIIDELSKLILDVSQSVLKDIVFSCCLKSILEDNQVGS
jgi:hypothetical protein